MKSKLPIISITIAPDQLARIDRIASSMNKSRSEIAGLLFADALERQPTDSFRVGIIHPQHEAART
jgi:predicted transcriptional regulator